MALASSTHKARAKDEGKLRDDGCESTSFWDLLIAGHDGRDALTGLVWVGNTDYLPRPKAMDGSWIMDSWIHGFMDSWDFMVMDIPVEDAGGESNVVV